MDVAMFEVKREKGGCVCGKGNVCIVLDGLAWMKRIRAHYTGGVTNDKTLLLLSLTQ